LQPFGSLHAIAAHEPVRAMALFVLALAALAALALDRLPREGRILLLGLGALALALVLGPRQALAPAFLVSLAAIAGVLVLLRSRLIPAVLAIPLVCLVLAGDLAWHGYCHGAGAVWQPASQATPQPAGSAAFLLARQAREGAFRVASVAPTSLLLHQLGHARSDVARALLLDQEAMRVGLEDVSGYNPVHLAAYDRTMLASNAGVAAERHFELALRAPTPQLRALAVRYYVSAPGHSPRGLPVVYRDALSEVSEDPLALPLARVLRAHGTTPARVVVRSPDRVVVAVAGTAAGRLVLADQAYPGWVVRVDGRTAHARTTADGLRAVDVPAGSHRVSWTFEPRSLRIGLLVTLASAALLALVAAAALRRRP
jgi:hypothetical protein